MSTRLDFYKRVYRGVYAPVMQMSRDGIRVDRERMQRRQTELVNELTELREKLKAAAGFDLFGAKGSLSHQKASKYFYEQLQCRKVMKKQKGKADTVTLNEFAVRTIRQANLKRPEVVAACDMILRFREIDALKKFYDQKTVDEDGRMRASYAFVPPTLRFSSHKNPMGTGQNLQNQPRTELGHFLPDQGDIFLGVDLSQAESRMVYMLTGDPELVQIARSMPWEYDDHEWMARQIREILIREGIVNVKLDEPITKLERYFGKQTNHGTSYGETGSKMSEAALKDGIIVSPEVCQEAIDVRMALRPAITKVFQLGIKRRILAEKILVNPFGHFLDFTYARKEPKTYRQGFMFIPQSTVPLIINLYGMKPMWKHYRELAPLRNQKHDELLYSVRPEDAWEIACFLRKTLERPVLYEDLTEARVKRPMTVPITLFIGANLQNKKEWKKFPTKREFMAVLEEVTSDAGIASRQQSA
jgi:hypothetical protein